MAQESFTVNLMDKKCLELFQDLKLSPWQPDVLRVEEECTSDSFSGRQLPESLENLSVSSKMSCSVCACNFHTRMQQREHYKLDWHRFNLKQSMMGAKSVSEEHFESMTEDISSISGSDVSDNETTSEQPLATQADVESQQRSVMIGVEDGEMNSAGKTSGRGPPKIFFENGKGQLLAVYRCLLQSKKEHLLTQVELVSRATRLQDSQRWAVLMVAGGHFAAAIFEGSEVVLHKTFHRYTVRAKRGTAQGVRDGQQGGTPPRSAGASLRRYNEAQLHEDVANLMKSWKDHIDGCSHIFIRAPSHNRTLLFGGKNPSLKRGDSRVRTMPFPTRRPTFKEVKRIQSLLSTMECFDNVDAAKRKFSLSRVVVPQKPLPGSTDAGGKITGDVDQEDASSERGHDDSVRGKPQVDGTSDKESDEDEVEFFLEEVTSRTPHLRETEISVPKKRQRRKKKNAKSDEDDGLKDKEMKKLQAALFTLCKTNEGDIFENLMMQLEKKICQDIKQELVVAPADESNTRENSSPETKCKIIPRENGSTESTPEEESIGGGNECIRILEDHSGAPEMTLESSKVCENSAVPLENPDLPDRNPSSGSEPLMKDPQCTTLMQNGVKPVKAGLGDTTSGQNGEEPVIADLGDTALVQNGDKPVNADVGDTTSVQNGHCKEVEERIAKFLNEKLDPSGNRFLHIAAINGHFPLVWKLMANGGDPSMRNVNGVHPITMAKGKSTRLEFSRFMRQHPNKFDYKAARIPAPLTEEQEAARAAKMKEKRKVQKKARGIRQKERKEEQQRKDKEEAERQAFVALSDREKRALAAEKRLANQLSSSSRCFTCGADLVGKTPFHYQDFKFCTMPCLKKHKQQHNS